MLPPFESYMYEWNQTEASMPETDLPPTKILARIMFNAMKPKELQRQVSDRCKSGRPPDKQRREMARWRQQATKRHNLLWKVIWENAEYLDNLHDDELGVMTLPAAAAAAAQPAMASRPSESSAQSAHSHAAAPSTEQRKGTLPNSDTSASSGKPPRTQTGINASVRARA